MNDEATAMQRELERLLVGTNDLRRRVGQSLYHYYRTLIFWSQRGRAFSHTTRLWCAAAASAFDSVGVILRDAGPPEVDAPLRAFLARAFHQLADDLERGEHMQHAWLRWLESKFPALTTLMREAGEDDRILDAELASQLAEGLALAAGAERDDLVARFHALASDVRARG